MGLEKVWTILTGMVGVEKECYAMNVYSHRKK